MKIKSTLMILLSLSLLQACASNKKLDGSKVANRQEPQTVSQANMQQTFLWGGPILSVVNEAQQTKITVLSYPLSRSEVPKVKETSGGRFVAIYDGFLEPTDYKVGNYITVLGQLSGFENGHVAQASYQYPVLRIQNLSVYKPSEKGGGYRLPVSLGIGLGIGL